ncbi:hypothetical protein HPS36_15665 (plasmid) [Halorubrum salinarum]|uniref:Rhomboid family protein n=1 Tax=Halorubrum salinarum TaxID=2739057 RepID=A0A7D4BTH5_9EURY|nr:hypothetical protein [Halorubrum salinarum]QKG94320.1 hypothetical protein HPS36_15665 [Halorubrum salinarum]
MTASDTQLLSPNQRDHADVVALFGVAIVLISVHLWLPSKLASELVFTYGNPSLVTAWTAATIHDSTGHLVSNLAWYGVVIGPAYALYTIWSHRRLFWLLYGSLLVVTPLATVAVDYWLLYLQWGLVGPNSIAFGFSGVVSAFGGLLAVGLAGVVAEWYSWRMSTVTTLAFVLSGLTGAAVRSPFAAFESTGLVAGGVLSVGVVGILLRWSYGRSSPQQWLSAHYDALVIVGACGFVLAALVISMFTVESISAGRFSNVLAHGTGFVIGVSVAAAGSRLV